MNKMVHICLVHYSHPEDTLECIASLKRQTVGVRIWVVGNGTPAKEWSSLQAQAGKDNIEWILSRENVGFAGGNNLLIQHIRSKYPDDDLLFLNNDTWVPEDFVEVMQCERARYCAKLKKKVALGAEEIGYWDGKKHHSGIEYISHLSGLVYRRSGIGRHPYLCGACIYVSGDAPLWNDEYFLYFEDVDYAHRLEQAGFVIRSVDSTYYKHKVGISTRCNDGIIKIQFESMHRYFKAHASWAMTLVGAWRSIEYLLRGQWRTLQTLCQVWWKRV